MGLHRSTAIRHLSYQQVDTMIRELSEQILNAGCPSLYYASNKDLVITALLSEISGLPILDSTKSWKFGFMSELDTDICLFKKNFNSEHYNRTVKCYVEDLYQEEDESFGTVTVPWRK